MSEDFPAILILAFYLVGGAAIAFDQFRRSEAKLVVWLFYMVERLYVGLLFRWRSNRRCPFPERGAAVIFVNHRSPVDPLLVWMNHHLGFTSGRIRVITFMMAREYYEVPFVNWICRSMQAIPVDRTGKDIRPTHEALERLKNGELLCLFPEGRINTDAALLEGDTGIAWLALHSQVPVYPVFLHNSPRSDSMVRPFCTPSRVRVTYGEPVDLAHLWNHRVTHELLTEVTDLLMRRLAELGGTQYVKDVHSSTGAPATVLFSSEQQTA